MPRSHGIEKNKGFVETRGRTDKRTLAKMDRLFGDLVGLGYSELKLALTPPRKVRGKDEVKSARNLTDYERARIALSVVKLDVALKSKQGNINVQNNFLLNVMQKSANIDPKILQQAMQDDTEITMNAQAQHKDYDEDIDNV